MTNNQNELYLSQEANAHKSHQQKSHLISALKFPTLRIKALPSHFHQRIPYIYQKMTRYIHVPKMKLINKEEEIQENQSGSVYFKKSQIHQQLLTMKQVLWKFIGPNRSSS